MKKSLIIFLAVLLLVSFIFAACSSKKDEDSTSDTTTAANLEDTDTEYGFETEAVTDADGKEVTDSKGNTVTTEVAVVYKKDSKGNTYAQKLDADGKGVTNKKGNAVTVKSTAAESASSSTKKAEKTTVASTKKDSSGTSASGKSTTAAEASKPTTQEDKTTATTKESVELTKDVSTTKFDGKEVVPKTSDSGKEVNFSEADQEIIASMLEVPYLYRSSYENADGIPIDTAVYTAVWMAQRDGATALDNVPYDSNPIILNLFKYYGNTVVNFKSKCNGIDNTPIKYKNNKFYISSFPEKQQSVKITKIEDLGNNNFYKITGTVSNAGKITKVAAVIQKNRLEPTLGFSIKALKWS